MPPKTEETNAVAVKLPEFYKSNPDMWFASAEAQFILANITEESTKYYNVIKRLDESVAVAVSKYTSKIPAAAPYTKLKAALIKHFTPTESSKAQAFFNVQPSGDMRPSDIMNNLIQLGPECCTNNSCPAEAFLFKQAFLLQLSPKVRTAMGGVKFTDREEYAQEADNFWEAAQAAELSVSTTTSEALATRKAPKASAKSSKRPETSSTSDDTLCWYHRKHGNNAMKCADLQSCTWSKNGPAGSRN